MHIQPILAALRRNKAGAILIGLQIALTLAIVCNALFIIQQRLDYLSRPTGLDEQSLFTFENKWVGTGDSNLEPLSTADLATVNSTPGVVDAYRSNSFPLRGGGWSTGVNLTPDEQKSKAHTAVYMVDDHALATLGTHLIAGRNFTPGEISSFAAHQTMAPALVIITRPLADELFPGGAALGKQIYMSTNGPPSTIIGVIDWLQSPWVGATWSDKFSHNCLLAPYRMMERGSYFIVRTKPGETDKVMQDVQNRLNASNRLRVIRKARTFAETRERAYARDKGMAILMGIVCTALLQVTAAGIVGLASFWVGQRQRQIGIRRALGATSRDILHYFQLENVLIGGGGALVGVLAAVGLNLWLVTEFEMERVPVWYVVFAAAIVLVLGQLAVLQPALRASKVPPVIATRSV